MRSEWLRRGRIIAGPAAYERFVPLSNTGHTEMRIAGVNFSLRCDRRLSGKTVQPTYRQFFAATDVPLDSINLRLEFNNFPDTGTMTRIFDSDGAWALFLQGDEYFLECRPPAFPGPFWTAHFDGALKEVTIHYSEKLVSADDNRPEVFPPFFYPLDQILIMYILSMRNGALLHAAGGSLRDRGFIFPGRSGAGKSTLSRLLTDKRFDMLSDDRVVVRKINGAFRMFGTPWAGDAGIAENRNCPLAGIFFIRHSDENRIYDIKPVTAMERLMPVTSIPWYDRKAMPAVLDFCGGLVSSIPAYELCFRPDRGAADLLEKFISSQACP